ncbi:MAG: hypothetical protein Q7S29_04210 [Candidatus Peribacter sp.]|nr:hypothetical protein [Candidatus Peribacter sp.]
MRTLFLDLASHHGLLACVTEERILASQPVDHRIGDHELIPLFEKTLQTAGLQTGDLTHCACIIGPGGFMSLRVAVAFANTLMHQLKIPGAGIHLSDLIAARVCHGEPCRTMTDASVPSFDRAQDDTLLWLHSTKKHELFVRGFGSYASLWPEAAHVTVEDFLAQVPSGAQWAGELIPEHEALFKDKKIRPAILRPAVEILPAFLSQQSFADTLLEPWYGRGW